MPATPEDARRLIRYARSNGFDDLPEAPLLRGFELLARDEELLSLLRDPQMALVPLAIQVGVVRCVRGFHRLRKRLSESPLPPAVADALSSGASLGLATHLLRTRHTLPEAVGTLAESLLATAWKEAQVVARVADQSIDEAFDAVGRFSPDAIPTARWLAWRRLENRGHLSIAMELSFNESPTDALESAVAKALFEKLDEVSQKRALDEAVMTYQGLLHTPPYCAGRLGALYVGSPRGPVGAAILDEAGVPLATRSFPPSGELEALVTSWAQTHMASGWVVPTNAADSQRLSRLRRCLPEVPFEVKPVAVSQAREDLEAEKSLFGLPREVLSAVVLGRRALNPAAEWGRLDPLELGLVEYQHDLEPDVLKETLEVVRILGSSGANSVESPLAPPLRLIPFYALCRTCEPEWSWTSRSPASQPLEPSFPWVCPWKVSSISRSWPTSVCRMLEKSSASGSGSEPGYWRLTQPGSGCR